MKKVEKGFKKLKVEKERKDGREGERGRGRGRQGDRERARKYERARFY